MIKFVDANVYWHTIGVWYPENLSFPLVYMYIYMKIENLRLAADHVNMNYIYYITK